MRYLIHITILLLTVTAMSCKSEAQIPDKEKQVKAAVMAAPEKLREDASVKGYNAEGELVLLKEGPNEILCLADDPADERFQVVCYHESLEPYMARGRELRKQGVENAREIREEEAASGKIEMPDKAAALYSLNGDKDAYDYKESKVRNAKGLYVLYVPYATVESTGFPLSAPVSGGPWLMRPGQPSAHIMMPLPETIGVKSKEKETQ